MFYVLADFFSSTNEVFIVKNDMANIHKVKKGFECARYCFIHSFYQINKCSKNPLAKSKASAVAVTEIAVRRHLEEEAREKKVVRTIK